jgi:inosine triphosphate pyrophosphatase
MALHFLSGNPNKVREVQAILGDVVPLDIELPEIQSLDAREIIRAKLLSALAHRHGEFFVEDTSLYLECLNGLPGPLVKWFLQTMGPHGLWTLAERAGDHRAHAVTLIGYARDAAHLHFFEGRLEGAIVAPRGSTTFGFDPIFVPQGETRTLAELSGQEKNAISMRRAALEKLRDFLDAQSD